MAVKVEVNVAVSVAVWVAVVEAVSVAVAVGGSGVGVSVGVGDGTQAARRREVRRRVEKERNILNSNECLQRTLREADKRIETDIMRVSNPFFCL